MSTILDTGTIRAIVEGDHGDPFSVLGMHGTQEGNLEVRAFVPRAESVAVVDAASNRKVADLKRIDVAGLFAAKLKRKRRFAYRLQIEETGGTRMADDPYRFGPVIPDDDLFLLSEGTELQLYDILGAHPAAMDGVEGYSFAVWAPNARRVSVVGPFNDWDGRVHPMRLRAEAGVWELFIPGIAAGRTYKYEIRARDGSVLPLKADPIAHYAEQPPATASVTWDTRGRDWADKEWMEHRSAANERSAPISIYEVHLGSWMRVPEEGNRYLSYRELGECLVPYVKEMGFTHLELLPISEHPFDGSWGYQPLGLFAPTSRFGTPDDFMAFVEACHAAGLGLLLDWVPGHFPSDPHGIGQMDGTHLYEHADPRKGKHMDWDTLIYNFGRREVANFLISNGLFWLDRYHVDGLRVDAVASMLYLNYSRAPDQWVPNEYGGNENLEAINFLKRFNEHCYGRHPGTTTMAEESTAWPMVTQPTYLGGLGFGYKWNMGWMHDTLSYMSKDPIHRRHHHGEMTFGLVYAFGENYVLPLSHDEVVHGKGSLIGKMPGDRWQKFANLRAYFGFMFTHPGKKLLFMGGEFGQEREWNHDRSLDWHLLDDPMHEGLRALVRDLNALYRSRPALHERDCDREGFEWIDGADSEQSVLTYLRHGHDGAAPVIVASNFTPIVRHGYRIGVPADGDYDEILNTDAEAYGGSGVGNLGRVSASASPCHGRPYAIDVSLPPLATVAFTPAPGSPR